MKNFKTIAILAGTLSALGASSIASAQNASNAGYWVDSRGVIARDAYNECWRSASWTPAMALPACESGAKAAAPAPAAAPKAAAAPAAMAAKTISLDGANFATNSSKLQASADARLNEVVKAAAAAPSATFSITGYTDNVGVPANNQKLSQERADSVKAYLAGKGVAASRMSTKGMGAENPIADNGTAEGRAKNRRVEVTYK